MGGLIVYCNKRALEALVQTKSFKTVNNMTSIFDFHTSQKPSTPIKSPTGLPVISKTSEPAILKPATPTKSKRKHIN
jgi:hypothetical protein